jgi:hypothetical protein
MKDTNKNTHTPELSTKQPLFIDGVMLSFWYSTIKWLILKPLVKLSYIINGKMIGDIKWYQRHFTKPVRWQWLNRVSYKLTKYVMFK